MTHRFDDRAKHFHHTIDLTALMPNIGSKPATHEPTLTAGSCIAGLSLHIQGGPKNGYPVLFLG